MTDTEILDYLDDAMDRFKPSGQVVDMNIGDLCFTIGGGRPKRTAREHLIAAIHARAGLVAKKLTNGS